MKRMIVAILSIAVLFMMSGIGQAQDYKWPEAKPGLLYKMASGVDRCAIYALGRGSIEIDCAKVTSDGGFEKGSVNQCIAEGVKQVCTPTLILNSFDTTATKCKKVCGGVTTWKIIR